MLRRLTHATPLTQPPRMGNLPGAVAVDPGRDQGAHTDHPPTLADREHQGVRSQARGRAAVQSAGPERLEPFDGCPVGR